MVNIDNMSFTTDSNNMMGIPFEVVSKQDCINYIADTTKTNYILMGLLLLFGIAILLWINREKFAWYQKLQMTKQMYNKDNLEKLGSEFTKMFETIENDENELDKKPKLVDIPTDFNKQTKTENSGDEK